MKNKIGLILSHCFVKDNEKYKFKWIEKSIDLHKKLYNNFYIVLSGHGLEPPKKILNKIDDLYWKNRIDETQIGMGHPHFVIEAYKMCLNANCDTTLKNLAFSWIENDQILKNKTVFCSRNTDLSKMKLGDLIMYGDTKYFLNLWSCRKWDYSLRTGLENLYYNMIKIYNNVESFKNDVSLFDSKQLGWKTFIDHKGLGPKYWGEESENWNLKKFLQRNLIIRL
jgi:hypothetical protein